MNTLPPLHIQSTLQKYGLKARKGLGQNFLIHDMELQKIVKIADINNSDTILEIGPGLGSLTRYLAMEARKVVAVELDSNLIPPLKDATSQFDNIEIIHGDILKINIGDIIDKSEYLVVANIPYFITSAIIRHLLEHKRKPKRIVLTIQLEVAKRICAVDGAMSILSLSVQIYGQPRLVHQISPNAFFPQPKIDSAVLCIDIYDNPLVDNDSIDKFFKLIHAGFSQKRKTLRNSLSAGLNLPPFTIEQLLIKGNIDPKRRAETLSIPEWLSLCNNYKG